MVFDSSWVSLESRRKIIFGSRISLGLGLIGRFDLVERAFILSRFAYLLLFFVFSCGDYFDRDGFDNLGEKKVCDIIKVRVRACTGFGVEEWGGCDGVDESIAWESDCAEARLKLEMGKLED